MITEQAVDEVLDGIDAAKVREQLFESVYGMLRNIDVVDCEAADEITDKLMEEFIITTRS